MEMFNSADMKILWKRVSKALSSIYIYSDILQKRSEDIFR